MESSINSSCSSECPTISAEETRPQKRRIEEENTGENKIMEADLAEESRLQKRRIEEENTAEKKIIEADLADAGKMKPQSPSSLESFLAENIYERVGVGGDQMRGIINKTGNRVIVKKIAINCAKRHNGLILSKEKIQILNHIMKALADSNTKIIGLHCSNEIVMRNNTALLEGVIKRANRDKMFDVILEATVTNEPNIKKIQDEIAGGLNFTLHEKSTAGRASFLHDSLMMKQKIFVILHKLYSGIDLGKVGIPYGADHSGCKILITSTSQDVLSNQMQTQKNFMV